MPRASVTGPVLALTLLACQNPERDELIGWLDDYEYERAGVRVLLCNCPEVLGFASEAECEAGETSLGASEKDCVADVFDGTESRGIDYYSCAVPALRAYGDCLVNLGGVCEADWFAPCLDEYESALAECPALSSASEQAIASCLE